MIEMNHLREAKMWLSQEYKPTPSYTNNERDQQRRDAVQQAHAHAAIAIADRLEKIADTLGDMKGRMP